MPLMNVFVVEFLANYIQAGTRIMFPVVILKFKLQYRVL